MKKYISYCIALVMLAGMVACKPKKCSHFANPRNSYHVKYDKKGLVKSKNKSNTSSSWNNKY